MADTLKIIALALACVAPCKSIYDTCAARSARQWACTWEALKRDGLWRLGPFEPAVPSVRLSDRSNAHRYCGPGCKAMEVGR